MFFLVHSASLTLFSPQTLAPTTIMSFFSDRLLCPFHSDSLLLVTSELFSLVQVLKWETIVTDSNKKEKDSGFVGEFALGNMSIGIKGSLLKALPQDILVQVLCGVNHEDLKQVFVGFCLLQTLIVKELHFEYNTPKKKNFYFLPAFDLENAE
ncbi:hypothetical protein Fmac_016403 [Flemingia macrophylla]|uniref:F-box protein n=1 Tax=Flemingia macrophylla TaxID=520843 RepID=A0ABD1MH91_9FABA